MKQPHLTPAWLSGLRWALVSACTLTLLWLGLGLWSSGQPLTAVGLLTLGGSALWVYATAQSVT